jgi:hypothetical protein
MKGPAESPARRRLPAHIFGVALAAAFVAFIAWGLYEAARPVPAQLQGVTDRHIGAKT